MGYLSEKEIQKNYVDRKKIPEMLSVAYTSSPEIIQPDKTYKQLVESYTSWVYTCIDKVAKSVATLPLNLYVYRNSTDSKVKETSSIKTMYRKMIKDDIDTYKYNFSMWLKSNNLKKEQVHSHPFLDLLQSPNYFMTRFMLWYETMLRVELGGLCGWYQVKDSFGIPREIWPLPLTETAELRPKVSGKLELEYWQYRDGNILQKLMPEELCIIKYPHPKSIFHWMSPLMAQTYPYDIDLFLDQQQYSLLKNQAVPGLIGSTNEFLDKPQTKEILSQWQEQHGSPTKRGKFMIFHSGLKPDKAAWSPREAMIDEVARYAREKLITAYDCSEGGLGLVRDVNRANMEALDKLFVQSCLFPKTMMLEEIIEKDTLPTYDQGLTADFELPDVADKEIRLKEREINLKYFYSSPDEERAKDGLAETTWGKAPWGTVGNVQLSNDKDKTAPTKENKKEDKEYKSTWKKGSTDKFSEWSEEKKRLVWELRQNIEKIGKKLFEDELIVMFHEQRDEILRKVEKYGKKWEEKSYADFEKARFDDLNIDIEEANQYTSGRFQKIYEKVMDDSGNRLLQKIGLTIPFDLYNPGVTKYLSSRLRMFSKEITETTFDQVQKILTREHEAGTPLAEVGQILRQKFLAFEKYRAPLIARTENNAASKEAEALATRQSGADKYLKKHWLTSRGPNRRETHIQAEKDYEKGILMNQNFKVGADTMDMPGNGSLPEENINCACDVIYSRNDVPL